MKLRSKDGEDLTGKLVKLRQGYFKQGLKSEDHLFRCEGGFGCKPHAMGNGVFGTFQSDGEQCKIHRSDIEGIVEEE